MCLRFPILQPEPERNQMAFGREGLRKTKYYDVTVNHFLEEKKVEKSKNVLTKVNQKEFLKDSILMSFHKLIHFLEFGRRDSRVTRVSRRFSVVTAMMSLARTRNHGACPVCASKMADVEDEVIQ